MPNVPKLFGLLYLYNEGNIFKAHSERNTEKKLFGHLT